LALRRLILPPFYWLSQAAGQIAPGNLSMAVLTSVSSDTVMNMTILWILGVFFSLAGGGGTPC
jgi:hypothetical protein